MGSVNLRAGIPELSSAPSQSVDRRVGLVSQRTVVGVAEGLLSLRYNFAQYVCNVVDVVLDRQPIVLCAYASDQ